MAFSSSSSDDVYNAIRDYNIRASSAASMLDPAAAMRVRPDPLALLREFSFETIFQCLALWVAEGDAAEEHVHLACRAIDSLLSSPLVLSQGRGGKITNGGNISNKQASATMDVVGSTAGSVQGVGEDTKRSETPPPPTTTPMVVVAEEEGSIHPHLRIIGPQLLQYIGLASNSPSVKVRTLAMNFMKRLASGEITPPVGLPRSSLYTTPPPPTTTTNTSTTTTTSSSSSSSNAVSAPSSSPPPSLSRALVSRLADVDTGIADIASDTILALAKDTNSSSSSDGEGDTTTATATGRLVPLLELVSSLAVAAARMSRSVRAGDEYDNDDDNNEEEQDNDNEDEQEERASRARNRAFFNGVINTNSPGVVEGRVFSLTAKICGISDNAFDAAKEAGLVKGLFGALQTFNDDPLITAVVLSTLPPLGASRKGLDSMLDAHIFHQLFAWAGLGKFTYNRSSTTAQWNGSTATATSAGTTTTSTITETTTTTTTNDTNGDNNVIPDPILGTFAFDAIAHIYHEALLNKRKSGTRNHKGALFASSRESSLVSSGSTTTTSTATTHLAANNQTIQQKQLEAKAELFAYATSLLRSSVIPAILKESRARTSASLHSPEEAAAGISSLDALLYVDPIAVDAALADRVLLREWLELGVSSNKVLSAACLQSLANILYAAPMAVQTSLFAEAKTKKEKPATIITSSTMQHTAGTASSLPTAAPTTATTTSGIGVVSPFARYQSLFDQLGTVCGRNSSIDVISRALGDVTAPALRAAGYDLLTVLVSFHLEKEEELAEDTSKEIGSSSSSVGIDDEVSSKALKSAAATCRKEASAWGLRKVYGAPGMAAYLLNRDTESSKEGKEWKFGVVIATLQNPNAREVLGDELLGRLQRHRDAGAYAPSAMGPAVATASRTS